MDTKLEVYRDIETPPGGWSFTVPETGFKLHAWTAKILAGKVMAHMDANDLPVPVPFWEWAQDQICRQMGLGEPFCGPVVPKPNQATSGLTGEMIVRFLKTIWRMAVRGFKLVPQDVAEARAAVCAGCPLNVDFSFGCFKCEKLLKLAGQIIGKRKTAVDDRLRYCAACGCRIPLKVICPKDVLDEAEKGSFPRYDERCWRLKEG